jgi:2,4-diketo-3-deoxy-L-fuconate hydrolase
MSTTVLRYAIDNDVRWGVLRDGAVVEIPGTFPSTRDFLGKHDAAGLALLDGPLLPLAEVRILSPVTRDRQFVCQGANYRQHMIDSGVNPDDKTFNMIFRKASSCIVEATSDIVKPSRVKLLDYEIELGLVFGRPITAPTTVTRETLGDYIAGVVLVNDVTARDIQIPEMQFYKGKSFRTFGPVGPWLVLLEPGEMHYIEELDLELTVNGQVRQKDNTANLVFKPAETLTELSGVQDFDTGDLLATGTPSGCALSIPSGIKQKIAALLPEKKKWELYHRIQGARPQYLKVGDVVESRIRSRDGAIDLGVQRNTVVAG